MARTGTTTHDPAKRERIMDAAVALFAERGFHGTPVPMVAEQAGVGTGTIYRYFANKEALVNALFQHWKAVVVEQILDGFPAREDAPFRTKFSAFWKGLTGFALKHPTAWRFLQLHHHGPYLDKQSRAMEDRILELAKELIDLAQKDQVVKDREPEILIALVHGAYIGLVKAHFEGWLELTPEVIQEAEDCAWEAIRR